ncbi:MAG: nuclear transport factor 2 family protein [Luteimonas sp.]|nr:nuclear transport factor 2 family protein [Luteimonas sp.]
MAGSSSPRPASDDDAFDYDMRMRANLEKVFSQRDAGLRLRAIADLYLPDAVLYEPDTVVTGHEAISAAVDKLLSMLPADFTFVARGPAVGHHGIGRLHWQAGAPGGPVAVTGTDVATFQGDRIGTLHVFLDPPA